MPKVSIVIPSYNRAEYIPATINSILKQSFSDFELIFIDDGSTDETQKIMEHFCRQDTRIKYFKQANSERAVARSFGMSLALGQYICLVDSDDIWYDTKLAKQISIMDSNPEIILCYAAVDRIDLNGNATKAASRQQKGESGGIFFKLLMRNFIPSVTPMFRKEILETVNKQISEFIPYEDWDFWLKISRLGSFHHIKEPLGAYRLHPGQSVQNVRAEKIEDVTIKVLNCNTDLNSIQNFLDHINFSVKEFNTIRNEAYSLAYLRIAYWYIITGKLNTGLNRLESSAKLSFRRFFDYRWWGLLTACVMRNFAPESTVKFLGSFH